MQVFDRRSDHKRISAAEPLELVKEYVLDPSAQVRENAATALAALAESSHAAGHALADMAVRDVNLPLQHHFVAEIAALSNNAREHVVSCLRGLMRSGDRDTGEAANLLLVRLRSRGVPIPADGIADTVRNALRQISTVQAKRARRPRPSLVVATLAAGLAAAAGTLVHVLSTANVIGDISAYVYMVMGTAAVAAFLALVAVRGATPAYTHLHRVLDAVVDVLAVFTLTTIVSVFIVPIVLVWTGYRGDTSQWIGASVFSAFAVGGLATFVRLGTLLASELSPIGRRGLPGGHPERWLRRRTVLGVVVETAAGFAAGLLAAAWLSPIALRLSAAAIMSPTARVVDGTHLFALSASLPLALAFALLDRPRLFLIWLAQDAKAAAARRHGQEAGVAPEAEWTASAESGWQSVQGLWARGGRRIVQAGALVFAAMAVKHVMDDALLPQRTRLFSGDGTAERQSAWFLRLPAQYDFGSAFLQRFRADATTDESYPVSLTLSSWSPAGKTADGAPDCSTAANEQLVASGEGSSALEADLGWGCYSLHVRDISEVEGRTARTELITALLNSWSASRREQAEDRAVDTQEVRLTVNERQFSRGDPSDTSPASGVLTSAMVIDTVPEEWLVTLPANTAVMVTAVPPRARIASSPSAGVTREQRPSSSDPGNSSVEVPLQLELFSAADSSTPLARRSSHLIHNVSQAGEYRIRVSGRGDDADIAAGRTVGLVSLNLAAVSRSIQPPATLPRTPELQNGMTAPPAGVSGFWRFDRVPASFRFRVESRLQVVARLPTVRLPNPFADEDDVLDLELFLDRGTVQIEQNDSDPEEIVRTLAPGDYGFRVETLSGDPRDIGFATLDLEFRVPGTVATRPPRP
jgi:hypothetical protein